MSRALRALAAAFALGSVAAPAGAHEVLQRVARQEAVVVTLQYADGSPFAYELYEVLPPGETLPFQTGRADALGRVAFLPDRPGEWRVKTSSEDGHGAELSIAVDTAGAAAASPRSLWERAGRLVAGVAILFGLFGVVTLFARRR